MRAAWVLGAGLSLWACYQTVQGLQGPSYAEPIARPRPIRPEERAALEAAAAALQADLRAAAAVLGAPPPLEDLEGSLPDGRPILAEGLPDNPLVEGVGAVRLACGPPPADPSPPDWWYCPQTGALAPAYPLQGSE